MLEVLLRRVNWVGVRRGMTGSRVWMALGIIAAGFRVLRWVSRSHEDILYRTALRPGDGFEILTKERGS